MRPVYMTPPPTAASPGPAKSHEGLFQSRQFRDIWMLVLFPICVVACFVIGGVNIHELVKALRQFSDRHHLSGIIRLDLVNISIGMCGGLTVSLLLSSLFVLLMYKFPKAIINICFLLLAVLMIIVGVISIVAAPDMWLLGAFFIVAALLQIGLYFYWRSRIPFSSILMHRAVDVMTDYPATILTSLLAALAIFLWSIFALISIVGTPFSSATYGRAYAESTVWFTAIMTLWIIEVITQIGNVTFGGVYSVFCYHGKGQSQVASPTAVSAGHALGVSLGSVALGSLVTPIVDLFKGLVDAVSDRATFFGALIACLFGWAHSAARYFNRYGYLQLATYNRSFCTSSNLARQTIRRNRIDEVANDHVVGIALVIGTIFVSACGVMTTHLICSLLKFRLEEHATSATTALVCTGVMAFFICRAVSATVNSGITSLFICMAEDPNAFARNDPELHNAVVQRYGNVLA